MAAFLSLLAAAQSSPPPGPWPVREPLPPPVPPPPPALPTSDPAPGPPSPPAAPPPSTCIELMPGVQCIESWIIYLASSLVAAVLIVVTVLVVVVKSREYCGRTSRSSDPESPHLRWPGRCSGAPRFAAWRRGAEAPDPGPRSAAKRVGGTGRRRGTGEGTGSPLPHGWARLFAADGSVYFYNHLTKQTSWWHPQEERGLAPPVIAERRAVQAAVAAAEGMVTSPTNRRRGGALSPAYDSCGGDSLRSLAPDWDELADPDGALFYRHQASGAVAWSRPVQSDRFSSTSQLVCDQV